METPTKNLEVRVTVRHESITDSLRNYAIDKVNHLPLEYPKIIDAKVILDVHRTRHEAEIVLTCANHIMIQASSVHEDMYAAIDEAISKTARRMRKQKTRLMKRKRVRPESIRFADEYHFDEGVLDHQEESTIDPDPVIIHRESVQVRTLQKEEAIMDLELSDKPFVLFHNERRGGKLQLVYRRKDGEYASIRLDELM